jgi:predicted RNase H-like nuclease (RuvC/YqgF family)
VNYPLTAEQFAALTDGSGNTPEAARRVRRMVERLKQETRTMAKNENGNGEAVEAPAEEARPSASKLKRLEAENAELKAKLDRIRKAFPKNGHIQRLAK